MRAVTRAVEVEAKRLIEPETPDSIVEWCGGVVRGVGDLSAKQWIELETEDGVTTALYGEWIIKDKKRGFSVCTEEQFNEGAVLVPEDASDKVVELLADYAHEAWSGWMRHMFKLAKHAEDGSVVIPHDRVERWTRQMYTTYRKLPGLEMASDRVEAAKILAELASIRQTVAAESDLMKIYDALLANVIFNKRRDEMNAQIHLAKDVRYSPITSETIAAKERLDEILDTADDPASDREIEGSFDAER